MESYLIHFGIPGMKWGIRRYQNEDGSLTPEGQRRLQSEHGGGFGAKVRFSAQKYGKSVSSMLGRKPKKERTPKEQAEAKARTRKILAIAGGVTLAAAGIALAARHRHKTTQNLIQLAKNNVHDRYNSLANVPGVNENPALHEYWKHHDSGAINSRRKALKELGLRKHSSARAFIRDNKVAKMKTHEIMERRMGPLVEGQRKNFMGRWKAYSGWRLERQKRQVAKRLLSI